MWLNAKNEPQQSGKAAQAPKLTHQYSVDV